MKYDPVSHDEFKKEALKIPGVKKAYDELEEEFALIGKLIKARKMASKSQKEVAEAMHTSQSVVARIESGFGKKHHSPSLDTLRKFASAVGCKLHIEFIPEMKCGKRPKARPEFNRESRQPRVW